MNHFAIYQFYIDTKGKEQDYLVGKVKAESENEAKVKYLQETYPNDVKKQEFIGGYLQAVETPKTFYEYDHSSDIKANKEKLGVWK